MTRDEATAEINKFISKIRIAETSGTYVVLTPAEAKQLLKVTTVLEEPCPTTSSPP